MESIFAYKNFRQYLKDKYEALKQENPAFSYRYFSKRAGFASPNFLKLVTEGQRNLSPESIYKFAEVFKLEKKETRFFELLVQYEQSTDPHQKQHYYQQILEFPEYRKVHQIEKEEYEYLSHWYYPAILELMHLPSFQEGGEWIANQLNKKISPKEVRETIDCLLKIGLCKRDANNRLTPAHAQLTTGEEARSLAAFSFHEQILEQAKAAVSGQNPEEREFAAVTMAINQAQLKKAKELIRDFRKTLLNYLGGENGKPGAVYQLGIQLFSLTTMTQERVI